MRQAFLVALKFLQGDISIMMVWQMNAPLRLRNRLYVLMDLSLWCDALTILVSSKNIDASIGRIPYQTENTLVTQAPPDESTCPGTSIGALGKAQAIFGKALYNRVRAAGLLKQTKCELHGTAYLVIGIQDDAAVIAIAKADGQWKAQLTLLRLVEFAALEAAARRRPDGRLRDEAIAAMALIDLRPVAGRYTAPPGTLALTYSDKGQAREQTAS